MEDIGLLAIRIAIGAIFVAHGTQKLTGWWGGDGLIGTGRYLAGFGFRPATVWAAVAGATELGAGIMFAVGLLTPAAAAGLVGVMFVAARTEHRGHGPWASDGGWEYPALLAVVALAVAADGPGRYSADHALDMVSSGLGVAALALVVGVGSAALGMLTRTATTSTHGEAVVSPAPTASATAGQQ